MKLRASMLCVAFFLTGPAIAVATDNAPLLPAPENAVMEPLSSHLKINGVDMRAVQFHVGAEEERLRSYFVEACAKLGGSYTENQLRNEHIQGCITPPYSLTSQWHIEGDSAYGTLTSLRMNQKTERDALPDDLPLPTNAQVLQGRGEQRCWHPWTGTTRACRYTSRQPSRVTGQSIARTTVATGTGHA